MRYGRINSGSATMRTELIRGLTYFSLFPERSRHELELPQGRCMFGWLWQHSAGQPAKEACRLY